MNKIVEMKPVCMAAGYCRKDREHKAAGQENGLVPSVSFFFIAGMFFAGTITALLNGIPVRRVMEGFSYDVLVIMIVMELFTGLVAATGIMQVIAVKIADLSEGRRRLCLMMFAGMMFLISAFLNNITAVTMVLPIVFLMLKTIGSDRRYVSVFFALILAMSNAGGAASPIGDFPALVILTSGITSFRGYLFHAFPFFALTAAALALYWGLHIRRERDDGALRRLAILNLRSCYRNIEVRYDVLRWLALIFAAMFMSWSLIPQDVLPPEMTAVLGYGAGMAVCALKKIRIEQTMDLRSVLTIGAFLFFAQVISQTGILVDIAAGLQEDIYSPKALLMVIMVITSLAAGIFSAGPAAAAMMPVIIQICSGPLADRSDWVAVAYAAAICAGSSLFMWSATAGFILSGKVNAAGLEDEKAKPVRWGVAEYMKYGIINYLIQISIALFITAKVL